MKKYFTIAILLILGFSARAQQSGTEISNLELERISKQAQNRANNFCIALSDLGSGTIKGDEKDQIKDDLLDMFIHSAKIEVTARLKNGLVTNKKPVKEYLDEVARYNRPNRYAMLEVDCFHINIGRNDLKDTVIEGKHCKYVHFRFFQRLTVDKSTGKLNQERVELLPPVITQQTKEIIDDTYKTGTLFIFDTKKSVKIGTSHTILLGDIKVDAAKITG